ncbi:hypothetical protein FPOAC2_03429 [Fusarium poae]|jgi:hypothetical protein|uniref:Uncharacterized protein n=1 Tax=Fusarium poae TaxID=36050 RepID=A0A1B8B927_FUSPO|nr:hypothetical protein FPOAC1_003322 [Fusarium poae]KAG8677306.1 hypothetical protein FPOAC1_003322 [Fusarium poae]OBS29220.1 hypothetical protein FPOA_03157 [Fusarium poae]
MVKKLLIAATMASMIPSANAFDPAKDRWLCQQDDSICITSFVWCSTIDEDTAKGCSYPENTWPESPNNFGKNPALVLWDQEYTISWKGTDDNYTTLIEWHFVRDTDRPSNSSNLTWSKKLKNKEKSYTFKFSDLASDFPSKDHDDIDAEQVKAAASNLMNVWAVSQPDRPYDNDARVHGNPWMDKSQHFIVMDDHVVPYLETQRTIYKQHEDVKWHNGVVLGVGVGVPFLLAAAFVLGRFTGRKRVKKRPGYKSVESYHSGYNSAYLGGQ